MASKKDLVSAVADKLRDAGKKTDAEEVLKALGRGSYSRVSRWMGDGKLTERPRRRAGIFTL
jgi:hypothetical protein